MEQEVQTFLQVPGVWAFVLNHYVIEAEFPIELAPGSFLNRATDEQQKRLKEALSSIVGTSNWLRPESWYECETIHEQNPGGGSSHQEPLPESEWRYYVVSTPDNGLTNINLQLASNISEVPLDLTGLCFYLNGGQGWNPGILQNHFQIFPMLPARRINIEALSDVTEVYGSFMGITGGVTGNTDFPEIQRAMQLYDSLRQLPRHSEFHVLGLFAIIEMLITHNPKLEDRGDSITHQMQSKIPLLSRRFKRALDFQSFFPNGSEKKVWTAMYGYRSAVAHGGVPDFQSADLRILKDSETSLAFLRAAVRALLRHSLIEPQLYRDLRSC